MQNFPLADPHKGGAWALTKLKAKILENIPNLFFEIDKKLSSRLPHTLENWPTVSTTLQKLVLCSIFPSYFYRSLLSLVDFVPIQVEVSLSPATDKTELVWNNIGAKCET